MLEFIKSLSRLLDDVGEVDHSHFVFYVKSTERPVLHSASVPQNKV